MANPHGVRSVTAYLEQNGTRYPLLEQTVPSRRVFLKRHESDQTYAFEAGKNKAPNLKEGKARLVVEAVSNDMRGSTDTAAADVDVVLAPPRVVADGDQHYINQGGMELVTITLSGSWNEAGVKVGNNTFRSFPLPGKDPNQRFAMFAYPWDLPADVTPLVYRAQSGGHGGDRAFLVQAIPQEIPRARFRSEAGADGEAGELGGPHRANWRRAKIC